MRRALLPILLPVLLHCGQPPEETVQAPDSGPQDAGLVNDPPDAGIDAGQPAQDAGDPDSGVATDAGPVDSGAWFHDAGDIQDAGHTPDAGSVPPDAGQVVSPDAGHAPDAGPCGVAGNACCVVPNQPVYCTDGSTCDYGVCVTCGYENGPCCNSFTCEHGRVCMTEGSGQFGPICVTSTTTSCSAGQPGTANQHCDTSTPYCCCAPLHQYVGANSNYYCDP